MPVSFPTGSAQWASMRSPEIVGFFVSAMGVALIFDGVIEALETHGVTVLH